MQNDVLALRNPNRILYALRPHARDFIFGRLETRDIVAGEVILEDGAPITHVIFPHEGVISCMEVMEDGRSVETVSVGNEGFLGYPRLMGSDTVTNRWEVQIPGYASWFSVEDMTVAFEEYECVRQAMLRYAGSLIFQLMQSVACNSLHTAEQQVARWLLHAFGRVAGPDLRVTQEALARLLGLRRATVNAACVALARGDAISYHRGVVTVKNEERLREYACECFDKVRSAFLPEVGMAEYFNDEKD